MNEAIFKVGDRVRVLPTKPNGKPHPHAGKCGTCIHVHSMILLNANVMLDDSLNIAVVSLGSLEHLTLDKEFDSARVPS